MTAGRAEHGRVSHLFKQFETVRLKETLAREAGPIQGGSATTELGRNM